MKRVWLGYKYKTKKVEKPKVFKVCFICKRKFVSNYKHHQYCSRACQGKATYLRFKKSKKITCKGCGKEAIVRKDSKGYCSRECSFENVHEWIRSCKDSVERRICYYLCKVYFLDCDVCGNKFTSNMAIRRTCSDECKGQYDRAMLAKKQPRKNYTCQICGLEFSPSYGDKTCKYCSDICRRAGQKLQRQFGKWNRRAREKANCEPFDPKEIFVRDGWRCHICHRKLNQKRVVPHPLAVTIDHIIPLSKGGAHTRNNVKTACFKCNSGKGNRTVDGGEQLLMFG